MQVNGILVGGTVLKYQLGTLETSGARIFDIELQTPKDPSGEGAVSQVLLKMQGNPIPITTAQASMEFEFIGTKILESLPGSGFLNPGSGGLEVKL